ncbi:MAG: hypothetical protein WC582_00010 [Patescibacteria group bacterium]
MKWFVVFISILAPFTAVYGSQAEELKFSKFEYYNGKNPFFSSFDTKISFKSKNKVFTTSMNNVRVNTKFGYSFPHTNILATCGLQQNAPWFAPEVDFTFWRVSTIHWGGWMFGETGKPKMERPRFFFALNAIYFSVKPIVLSYTLLHFFENEPDHIPGISFSQPINKNFTWLVGTDYSTKDANPMFNIGMKFTP